MLLYYRKETNEQASYEYRIHKYIISRYYSKVGIVYYNSSHYYTVSIDSVCRSSVLLFADTSHLPFSFLRKKNDKKATRMANNTEETIYHTVHTITP